jgi:nucleoside-triphosphatase THEP1
VLYLVENKKIVLVGIPGVGKTSLLTKVVGILKNKNIEVKVIS